MNVLIETLCVSLVRVIEFGVCSNVGCFCVCGWTNLDQYFLSDGLGGLFQHDRRQVHGGARLARGRRHRDDAVRTDEHGVLTRAAQQRRGCRTNDRRIYAVNSAARQCAVVFTAGAAKF